MKATCLPCAMGHHQQCQPGCTCCGRPALARQVAFSRSLRGAALDRVATYALAAAAVGVALGAGTLPVTVLLVVTACVVVAQAVLLISRRRRGSPLHRRRRGQPRDTDVAGSEAAAGHPVATRRRPHTSPPT